MCHLLSQYSGHFMHISHNVVWTYTAQKGLSTFRAYMCVCVGATHTTFKQGFEPHIWAPKAPFSLTFHGRLTPLAVYRRHGRCRFGAPERTVSTRFEIDSWCACVRERIRVSVGLLRVCVRESNLSFCRGRPRDGVDRDLESAVNVELAATEVAIRPRPYYAITCRGKDAQPFFASLIRRH